MTALPNSTRTANGLRAKWPRSCPSRWGPRRRLDRWRRKRTGRSRIGKRWSGVSRWPDIEMLTTEVSIPRDASSRSIALATNCSVVSRFWNRGTQNGVFVAQTVDGPINHGVTVCNGPALRNRMLTRRAGPPSSEPTPLTRLSSFAALEGLSPSGTHNVA